MNINEMPLEMLLHIKSFLPKNDQTQVFPLVCKKWNPIEEKIKELRNFLSEHNESFAKNFNYSIFKKVKKIDVMAFIDQFTSSIDFPDSINITPLGNPSDGIISFAAYIRNQIQTVKTNEYEIDLWFKFGSLIDTRSFNSRELQVLLILFSPRILKTFDFEINIKSLNQEASTMSSAINCAIVFYKNVIVNKNLEKLSHITVATFDQPLYLSFKNNGEIDQITDKKNLEHLIKLEVRQETNLFWEFDNDIELILKGKVSDFFLCSIVSATINTLGIKLGYSRFPNLNLFPKPSQI